MRKFYRVEFNTKEVAGVPGTSCFTGHVKEDAVHKQTLLWCKNHGHYVIPALLLLPETNTCVNVCRGCLMEKDKGRLEAEVFSTASFQCGLCDAKYDTYSLLNLHIKFRHGNGATSWRCAACGEECPDEEAYKAHCGQHLLQFTCEVCGQQCNDQLDLEEHVVCAHGTGGFGSAIVCTLHGDDDVETLDEDLEEETQHRPGLDKTYCFTNGCLNQAFYPCVICGHNYCQDCVHLFKSSDGHEAGCKMCMEGRTAD